jgi:uncharacterized protein YndB with AHSA1/START domain
MSPSAEPPKVIIRRTIPATRQELFDAWTDPDSIRIWMCPGTATHADATLDVRPGGRLHIVMHAPGETFVHDGEYREVNPPAKLVFTWTAKAMAGVTTLVTVDLFERGPMLTELVLTHELIPQPDVRERYQNGWSRIVELLDQHLQGRKNG